MREVTIRTVRDDELEAWVRALSVPFLEPSDDLARDAEYFRRHLDLGRTWAADDRGRIVGTCCVYNRKVTLPGGAAVPFAAVSAVTVLPTHRRQGILNRMMAEMLDDARRRGEPLAGLTASESAIYGRYGYGTATYAARLRLDAAHAALAVPAPELDIELVDAAEAAKRLPDLYSRHRASGPGEVDRTEAVWADIFADRADRRGGLSAWYCALSDEGYALYRSKEDDDPEGHNLYRATLYVRDLVGADHATQAALWRFLCGVDFVRSVELMRASPDDPLRHRLADPRQLRTLSVVDFLWLRVLDTAACLQGRRYWTEGSLVMDVLPAATGGAGDQATGRWRLDAGPDGSSCRRAAPADATDLTLNVADLGSLLLGGVQASALAGAGRIGVERDGALGVADALFSSDPAPLTTTGF